MYRFALKILLFDRGKLITALIGVIFSLVLVNVQGGLFVGLINKASVLIDNTDVDIWVGQHGVENVDLPGEVPAAWLNRIKGLPGVEQAEPYIVGSGTMTLRNGTFEAVWIIGSAPDSLLGSAWTFAQGSQTDLRRPNAIAVDQADDPKLNFPEVGDNLEISHRRAQVVAKTRGTLNFMTTPVVFTTLETARRYARVPDGYCSYLLVRAQEGSNLSQLADRIRSRLPDADVYTADEFRNISRDYWMKRTGIGLSFGAATLLGLLVGFLMIGQSLYALALDHLGDYATLKAIGAEDRQIGIVVILQALAIATIGSFVGVVLVVVIQSIFSSPLVPIEIPLKLLFGGVVLVFNICFAASILPFFRIRRVDPAMALQG